LHWTAWRRHRLAGPGAAAQTSICACTALTKATTLGVGGMIVGSVLYFSTRGDGLSLHELLITLFLFITAPVSAHMLAKAALHLRLRTVERTRGSEKR
jgi:monovalent cation/proton antiporter MnhG/PhaG subunit